MSGVRDVNAEFIDINLLQREREREKTKLRDKLKVRNISGFISCNSGFSQNSEKKTEL